MTRKRKLILTAVFLTALYLSYRLFIGFMLVLMIDVQDDEDLFSETAKRAIVFCGGRKTLKPLIGMVGRSKYDVAMDALSAMSYRYDLSKEPYLTMLVDRITDPKIDHYARTDMMRILERRVGSFSDRIIPDDWRRNPLYSDDYNNEKLRNLKTWWRFRKEHMPDGVPPASSPRESDKRREN